MPDMNKILFIRAKRCDDCTPEGTCDSCIQGYNAAGHVLAENTGGWSVIDAGDNNANKQYVDEAIEYDDPGVIFGFGHGNQNRFTAQYREDIFTTSDCDRVSGRIVYLLSCLTANQLGPMMMEKGALAYAGFNQSWTWIADTDEYNNFLQPDPYFDKYAQGFYESAVAVMVALCAGYSFIEAIQASIQKYNDWIQYWYDNPDPASQDCIMWLAFDRDALVAFSNCDEITDEQTCVQQGCLWEATQCATIPRHASINPVLLIPVVFVVGIAFVVFKGKL